MPIQPEDWLSSLGTVTENRRIAKPSEMTNLIASDAGITVGDGGSAPTPVSAVQLSQPAVKPPFGVHPTTVRMVSSHLPASWEGLPTSEKGDTGQQSPQGSQCLDEAPPGCAGPQGAEPLASGIP